MIQFLRMRPIMLGGIAAGELLQWCLWKGKHPDDGWGGYWKVGLPHLGVNFTIVLFTFVAWHCGVLSAIVEKFGGTPIAQLLAVSPPVGFLITMLADVFGDQIAFAARVRAKRIFCGKDSAPSLPTVTPKEETP